MIEPGTYSARAVEATLAYTRNADPQVAVLFELLDGEHKGQHVTWYGYFTDKTKERTLESLEHCGWDGDDISDLSGIDRHEVQLVIEHEEDQQGQLRARVRWVNAAGGLAIKERMDAADAKAFAQRMRGEILARRKKSGASAPTPARKPESARKSPSKPKDSDPASIHGEDDIPF